MSEYSIYEVLFEDNQGNMWTTAFGYEHSFLSSMISGEDARLFTKADAVALIATLTERYLNDEEE